MLFKHHHEINPLHGAFFIRVPQTSLLRPGSSDAKLAMNQKKTTLFDISTVILTSTAVIAPQWYLLVSQTSLGWTAFVGAVVVPTLLGSAIFWFGKRRILFFAFLAYIWAIVEDAPVYLDSVFTWPQVTSGLQHAFLEILFHLLTLGFMLLAIREALKGSVPSQTKLFKVFVLTMIAFILSYGQNIPLDPIQDLVRRSWIQMDVVEHLVSIVFFYLAIKEASKKEVLAEKMESKSDISTMSESRIADFLLL